jgi:translation initiation factor IF-3
MIGIVSGKGYAQARAIENDMDLVMISPNAKPPVCKIMDYGKFMFEKAKKEKEAKKNQKVITIKEIWLKPKIEKHDFDFKAKHASKFLSAGNKVKVSVRFRGREMQYTNLGKKVLMEFVDSLKELGTAERNPKLEGRNMSVMLSPNNNT